MVPTPCCHHAATGKKLWSAYVGTGIVAPPITYMIDGKQYVSVMAGWGGAFPKKFRSPGRLLTFAIGGTATPPVRTAPRHGDCKHGDARSSRGRREVVWNVLRALSRWRDGAAGSAAIGADRPQ